MEFERQLRKCKTIGDVFELVKEVAAKYTGKYQAGLMVGLSDMGSFPDGFIGALYSPYANMIVVNTAMLDRVRVSKPSSYEAYVFYILLHEYIHSLGVYDEIQTRMLTHDIAKDLGNQTVVELSKDMGRYLHDLLPSSYEPPGGNIEFVPGIDRKNTSYIG
jgi:hypothetical protein